MECGINKFYLQSKHNFILSTKVFLLLVEIHKLLKKKEIVDCDIIEVQLNIHVNEILKKYVQSQIITLQEK